MEESKKFFLLKKVFVNGDSQQMVVLQPFFLQILKALHFGFGFGCADSKDRALQSKCTIVGI